jgi:hypothetical protein
MVEARSFVALTPAAFGMILNIWCDKLHTDGLFGSSHVSGMLAARSITILPSLADPGGSGHAVGVGRHEQQRRVQHHGLLLALTLQALPGHAGWGAQFV